MLEYFRKQFEEFKNAHRKFESDGRTKDCFFHDKTKCEGKYIKAHSLQRNGVLNIVESEVEGNKVVYSFRRMDKNPFDQYLGFRKIGKGNASTFFGFCVKHDKEIFQEIEDKDIDITNEEHKFLLCYRAVARSYHRKVEQIKSFQNNTWYNKPKAAEMQADGVGGSQAGLDEIEEHRTVLNSILQSKNFNELRYFSHTVDYTIPIACTSILTPKFYLDNTLFNHSDDLTEKNEAIYLTILPTAEQTHILYACLPRHLKSMKFIDDLEELETQDLEHVTCSLMINHIENGFISPSVFEKLDTKEQEDLIKAIEISDKMGFMHPKFPHLQYNFFEEKFKRKTENNIR